jgi:cellobiose phosphorylase
MRKSPAKSRSLDLDQLVTRARRNLAQGKSPRADFTPREAEALAQRYSSFEDLRDGDGFLIESRLAVQDPDTPRPWLHLMTSNHNRETGIAGSFWDPTGLGFLCYDSVLAGPVTSHKDASYVPTAPRASDLREFILREDGKTPTLWHMLPQVGREPEAYRDYSCQYGLGWVKVGSARHGIHSELRVFVPVDDPCEIWSVTFTNLTARARRFQFFARVNWGLETHPAYYFDPRVTSEGRHLKGLRALIALNHDKSNALPRTGFMMSSAPFQGFDLSGEAFVGGGRTRLWPRAVEEGQCRGSLGRQPYLGLVGALQYDLELASGESKTLHIVVGRTERDPAAYEPHLTDLRKRLLSGKGPNKEFARLEASWREMLDRVVAKTPDEEVDRVYNIWLKYQQHNTARFTRALDQIGYRDVLQDLLGLCSFNPEYVRAHLPTVLNYQLRDGRAVRQFFRYPGTKAPNDERMYADSPVWIADTLVSYLEETGDFAFLEQQVGFYDLATHRQDNTVTKSIYEHALTALEGLYRHRGQHGLCLIGHGDWNDALDGLSKRGQGVSTWLSMALIFASQRMLRLARHLRDTKRVALLETIIATMTKAVNEACWDGDHYVFGFNDAGEVMGSDRNEEGKIHATVNAWALFTGVAAAGGREEALLQALRRLWSPIGTVLTTPPYTSRSREVAGRIADIMPGQFENGAMYTHGHSFFLYGLVTTGRADQAYEEMKLSLPENTFPDLATGAPHQQSNFAVGPSHPDFGTNLYSNFSGSTAWYLRAIDNLLGVMADFDGLRLAPTAPAAWKEYRVRKQFRGRNFDITFHHQSGRHQMERVTVNGRPLAPVQGEYKLLLADLPAAGDVVVEVFM